MLRGGTGTDWLVGGGGFDTYLYRTGDGSDFIVDDDRRGRVVIESGTLADNAERRVAG